MSCCSEDDLKTRREVGIYSENALWSAIRFLIAFAVIFSIILGFAILARADQNFSDDEIVNAIYQAEGGSKAKYPYGIRSVHCETISECRKICKNTVKKNRVRFAEYGNRKFASFIDFLASRYCPTSGRNLSKAERKLNGNWIKNVSFYLAKARKK